MIKRILAAALLLGVFAAPGWLIQGSGGACVVTPQTFSTPGAFVYTATCSGPLITEAIGGGSGGGHMFLSHAGGVGGNAASYAADTLTYTAGATYNVVVGQPGLGTVSSVISVPGTISYVCPTAVAACTNALTTCADRVGLTLGTWVCANNEDLGGTGSTVYDGGFGGHGGTGGGAAAGGGGGSASTGGPGLNGGNGGNNCSSTGGAGGDSPGKISTNATTAAGNATLHFAGIPSWFITGLFVNDITAPTVVPAATTILSISSPDADMSANATGAGVGSADELCLSPDSTHSLCGGGGGAGGDGVICAGVDGQPGAPGIAPGSGGGGAGGGTNPIPGGDGGPGQIKIHS